MNKSQKELIRTLTLAAMCLALAIVLPFLTMQIPQIGQALSPMHIPALLCGFICGPFWGAAVGFVAPLLRHLMFGMPPLMTAIAMAFELAAYGFFAGLFYKILPKKIPYIYVSLVGAMIVGRIVWGIVKFFISIAQSSEFTFAAFIAGAVTGAIPGIICHIILVPLIVIALKKARLVPEDTLATA
ncbi:MAG: ECF transporter S component [Eubacteriales bacterium]